MTLQNLKSRLLFLFIIALVVALLLYTVLLTFNMEVDTFTFIVLVMLITALWTAWGSLAGRSKSACRVSSPERLNTSGPRKDVGRPVLVTRNAREYYGHREDFQAIIRRVGSPDGAERIRDQIETEIKGDPKAIAQKRLMLVINYIRWCGMGAFSLCIALLFLGGVSAWSLAAGLIAAYSVLLVASSALNHCEKAHEARRKFYFDKHGDSLRRAEDRDILLTNRIEAAWDSYCVNHPDAYPPDWGYRKMTVRERDGQQCTQCGWPTGVTRKVRQLHVHHKKLRSQGGNHALSNLVTLCDICHRKQEGSGHSRINPRRRRRRDDE